MHSRYLATVVTLGMCAAMATAAEAGTLECRSDGHRYNYCRANTDGSVRLLNQISNTKCREGQNWGYDARGIWVDQGCTAKFDYGYGGGRYDRGDWGDRGDLDINIDRGRDRGRNRGRDNTGAVVAGVAALAILAAISHSDKSRQRHSDDDSSVPGWAVGTFSGGDNQAGADMSLNIDRNGRIDGYYGHSRLSGQFDDERVWLGNREYRAEQAANGLRLTAEDDTGMVIFLYRD